MLRNVIILIFFINSIYASQLIIVLSKKSAATTATLQKYESNAKIYHKVGKSIKVNLGRSGMKIHKIEGDGSAPEGIFKLGKIFAYNNIKTRMPFIKASYDLICVDDTTSKNYNKMLYIAESEGVKSFEFMHRDDKLYKYGVVINHNPNNKVPQGSCVFLHIQKAENSPTSGCTSMSEENLKEIIEWLDEKEKPLILQTTQENCKKFTQHLQGVTCKI